MKSLRVRKLMEATARANGVSVTQVDEVLTETFRFVAEVMKSGNRETQTFDTIDVPGLGVFTVKPKWTERMIKHAKPKNKKHE